MNNNINDELKKELYDTLIKLQTREDCELLLADLCTINEVMQMAQRLRAAKLLLQGETYNEVITNTDISSATLSRVSNCVRHGNGGYRKFIDIEKDKNPSNV